MIEGFLMALSAVAAPIISGNITLFRCLIVLISVGIVAIALLSAHTKIQGELELQLLERRMEILAEADARCRADQILQDGRPQVDTRPE